MAATISVRTDDEVKEEAEKLFRSLGLNMTGAVNMFLHAALRERTLPINLKPLSLNGENETSNTEDYNPMYYDVMRESANRLGGRYIYLARKAETKEDEEFWRKKDLDLRLEIRNGPFDTLGQVQRMQESLNERLAEVLRVGE
ncbi:MAG: type II toxin-antitoxin system RelB/DinJ family antitoxin [Actinomycetaceae bacterium]|nr:type II toxin-antitoxin system RelB/DinJ family antitoxin [Actinomycetaceae bacterium]